MFRLLGKTAAVRGREFGKGTEMSLFNQNILLMTQHKKIALQLDV